MKTWIFVVGALAAVVVVAACNNTGLAQTPRASFAQLACLDLNGDHRINELDTTDPSRLPDFNGDTKHDENDAAFLRGVDIPLDPAGAQDACKNGSNSAPEYLVAHGYFEPSKVSCTGDAKPVLLVGVGGGVVNLKDKGDAAGVRSMIDGLQKAYSDRSIPTVALLAGPAIVGAQNGHSAMEQFLTHAVQVYLDHYPCLRVLLLGHSHGGVTVDVISARLEGRYASRFVEVVDVDRVDALYNGDTQSRPTQVHVFNIYETHGPILLGKPYDAPNADNWNADDQQAPKNGDKGGPLSPVNHTTIDNSDSVKKRIIEKVMALPA